MATPRPRCAARLAWRRSCAGGNPGRSGNDHCTVPTRPPAVRRTAAAVLLTAAVLAAGTGTAAAHVEVAAQGAVAGTGPVTLDFSAAAESSAGIAALRTQLPDGIDPAGVTLAAGPPGWTLTSTAEGFAVGGPPLPGGQDARYAVTVAALPAGATELAFPTVQVYADGSEDAWIEQQVPGGPDPERPAPVLAVAPGSAPPASTTAPSSPTVQAQTPASPTAAAPAAEDEQDEEDSGWPLAAAVVAAGVAGVGGSLWYRRSRAER